MKTLKKILMGLAVAVGIASAAQAATPTVVWDGDFDKTEKVGADGLTYTLNVQGNTVTDGKLEITKTDVGAKITPPSGSQAQVSVLIKYSNLAAISGKKPVIATAQGNYTYDIGLAGHTAGGLGLNGFYNNDGQRYGIGSNASSGLTETLATPVEGAGYFLFTYSKSGGTAGYAGAALSALTGNKSTKLKWNNTNPDCFCVGGPREKRSNYPAWTGLKIEAVAVFYGSELTAADVATYKFPSECGDVIKKNATWGNIGDATNGGIATNVDKSSYQVEKKSYTLDFTDASAICTTGIGSNGYIAMTKVRLAVRPDDADIPASVTLSQTDGPSITSYSCDTSTKVNIYKSDKSSIGERTCAEYSFAPTVCFDTSKAITVTLNRASGGTKVGMTVIKPGNTTFAGGADSWSPAYEFIGDYYHAASVISINMAQYWKPDASTALATRGQVSGDQTTMLGTIPAAGWCETSANNPCTYDYTAGIKFAFPLTKCTVKGVAADLGGTAGVSGYAEKGTNLRYDGTEGSFRYTYLTAKNQSTGAATLSVTNLPFAAYDAIIYMSASDTTKMNPVSVNGTYLYPTATEGVNTQAESATSPTWGDGRSSVALAYGTNVMRVNGLSGDLELAQTVGHFGIAAVQIVEATPKGVDYEGTITADTAKWSDKTGIESEDEWENGASNTITLSNTTVDNATLTFDENVTAAKLTLTSGSGKNTTLAKTDGATVAIPSYDFSGAAGKTTVGYSTGSAAIKAGTDTVLNALGTGTLTIGSGKKATAPAWDNTKVTGAGTLDISAATAETAVTWNTASNFTGVMELLQGTWTVTAGGNSAGYPRNSAVVIGANGKLVVTQNGDATGYNGDLSKALTLKDGGVYLVENRDTFSRTMILDNGGKLTLKSDDTGAGRSIDMFGSSTIQVKGSTPCVIGGLTPESTTASGKIAIRRKNFTVTVSQEATLNCYAQWATSDGSGDNFIKAGAGKLVQYRDASSALPFVVNGGTIKFVNGGRTTTAGMTLNDGTKLELSATGDGSYTLANAITGKGRVEKQDAGTYTLSGANAYEGTTTVKAGTLKVTGSSIGTGNYTVDSGAMLDLGQVHNVTLEGTSAGTVKIMLTDAEKGDLDAGKSVELIGVTGDAFAGTLTTVDGTGTDYEIETPTVSGGKIVVQKKVGSRTPPYNVTNPTNETWTIAGWMDSSTPALEVRPEDWDKEVSATVTVAAETTRTLTADRTLTLGTLAFNNAGTLTVSVNGENALTAAAIDDSASTGKTTIDFAPGAATVAAGADTVLTSVGTGAYTIAADKKLTVSASGLKKTQLTNNGTLNVVGGTLAEPVVINDNGNANTGLGTVTIASGVVRDYATNGNKVYNISGVAGETTLILGSGQNWGMTEGTSIRNTKVIVQDKEFWLERDGAFDSTVDLQIDKKLHICNNKAYTIGSLSGSADIVKTGSESLTITMDRAASEYSGASQNAMIVAGTYTLTLSGASTGALTVNSGATVKLTGSANPSTVSNAGTIIFDFGAGTTNVLNGTSKYNGAIEVASGVVLVTEDFTGTVTATGTGVVKTGYNVGVNDLGKFKIPDGKTADQIVLFDNAGNVLPITKVENGYVYFDWEITGGACWWDYEFNEAGTTESGKVGPINSGTEGTRMSFDGDRPTALKGKEYVTNEVTGAISIRVPTRPWRDVSTWPEAATFVMYGTMVKDFNRYQIVFGSSGYGNYNTIFLATGDAANEVVLCTAHGSTVTKLCTMTVPNATTADHLYAFTLKTVGGNTVIDIYLDGELLQEYPFTGTFALGPGFQIASPHGGPVTGYARPAEDDPATLDWLRVYDVELSKAAIEKYAVKYPYVSPNGSYQRTVKDGDLWSATDAWTVEGTTPEEKADVPVAGSTVKLTVEGTTTLGVNLDADVSYEAIKINGDDLTIALAAGEQDGKVISAGRVTAGANVTFKYDAFTMFNAPLTVKAGKKVTFDLSMVDMTKFFTTQTYDLTGYTTLETGANVTFTPPAQLYGREITAAIDETTKHYILTVTVPVKDFNYTDGNWTWGDDQPVDGVTVSNNTALAINVKGGTLEWGMDRATFAVKGGTLKATAAATVPCAITVEEGATFDLNGTRTGTPENTYVVTLNGGTLANSAEGQGVVKSLTLTDDSAIALTTGSIAIQSASGGWAATTLALDDNTLTLTKTGDGEARLEMVSTAVTGTGTIDVQSGTLWTQETSNYGDALVKLGATGVFEVRDEKTATVKTIEAVEGATIYVHGTTGAISAFTLKGTAEVKGTGSFGTITMTEGSVLNVGSKRGLTFAGKGTVNAVLTADEIATAGSQTIFTTTSEDVVLGTVKDADGNDVACTKQGGAIVVDHAAKIGNTGYFTLQDALNAGGDVVMLKNATSEVTVPAGKTVNLDFNGYKITTTSRQAINNRGTLTITNGNVTAQESAIVLWGNSVTIISGGSYTAVDNAVIAGNGNEGEGGVTLTITGGTFTGGIQTSGYIACGLYVPNSGTYAINGGTFNITGGCGVCARAGTTKIGSDVVFNVTGDTTGWVGDKKSQVPCVAAYFDWTIPPYPGYAEGDTILSKNNTLTTAEGQIWFGKGADGYHALGKENEAGAKIGTTYYLTLADAAAMAQDRDTVTLLAEATADDLSVGVDATLDLNGQTLTVGEGQTFTATGEIEIVNNGGATGGLVIDGVAAVNGGLDLATLAYGDGGLVPNRSGTLSIGAEGTAKLMNVWAGYSPNWLAENRPGFLSVADGGTVQIASAVYTAKDGFFSTESTVAKATVTAYGVTYAEAFDTLAAAVAAANAGTTVTLLRSAELNAPISVAKQVTLDIGTYNVTPSASFADGDGLFFVNYGGDFTVNGTTGTIDASSNAKIYEAIKMTVTGETYTGTRAKLTVNANIKGYYYGITGNGSRPGTDITVSGGTITAVADEDNLAIYNPQCDSTVTITGGTLTGYLSAVEMRGGTLTVTGGTLTATATEYAVAASGSGTTTKGAAVAIAQHSTKGAINVSIAGGTLTGLKAVSVANPQENDSTNVAVTLGAASYTGDLAFTADGNAKVTNTGAEIAAPEGYAWDKNGVLTKCPIKIGTTFYLTLAEAVDAAQPGDTILLIGDVDGGDQTVEVTKNITFDGDVYEVTGAGFTGSGLLTVAGGFIGVTSLPANRSLVGGKYKDTKWDPAANYHYAEMASSEITGYAKQIIAGASGQPGEKVYPITDGGETQSPVGDLAFTKDELVQKGIVESTATDIDIAEALNTPGANERPTWENVVLGLSNTDSLAAPVPTPVQSSDPSKLTLKLANLDVSTTTGAKVTYKITTTTAAGTTTKTVDGLQAEFALPESGVSYYKFDVTVTPAK